MNPRIVVGVLVLLGAALAIYAGYQAVQYQFSNRPAAPKPLTLVDYIKTEGALVRYTVEGPVVANELHNSIVITVTKSGRSLITEKTYENQPGTKNEFGNNQAAFEDFMRALQDTGFTSSRKSSTGSELGQCPSGQRYIYELVSGGKTIMRSWSTTCGDEGTFDGTPSAVRRLFQSQIPNYRDLIRGTRIDSAGGFTLQ